MCGWNGEAERKDKGEWLGFDIEIYDLLNFFFTLVCTRFIMRKLGCIPSWLFVFFFLISFYYYYISSKIVSLK